MHEDRLFGMPTDRRHENGIILRARSRGRRRTARTDEEKQALGRIVPGGDQALSAWAASQSAATAAETLVKAGIPAAALARYGDLVKSSHLAARDFWDAGLPGLPWRASFGRATGPAPALGADTDQVLADVLGLSKDRISGLHESGALG